MKYILTEQIGNEQIMLIQNELTCLFFVTIESIQNYSFSPHYVSKAYKSKVSAKKHFNVLAKKLIG